MEKEAKVQEAIDRAERDAARQQERARAANQKLAALKRQKKELEKRRQMESDHLWCGKFRACQITDKEGKKMTMFEYAVQIIKQRELRDEK